MDWHSRYSLQASWTSDLRAYLFERTGLQTADRVLEVGCGTGAVLSGLSTRASIHGLDIDPMALAACRQHASSAILTCGDAQYLPYPPASFDIIYCHFLLLWVPDPLSAVREMKRLVRPAGYVLALAEPDYSARVDRPSALEPLGRWQAESLRRQGADPALGSRLAGIFSQAGLRLLETGRLQNRPPEIPTQNEWKSEWEVLESDLEGMIPTGQLRQLRELDKKAWLRGERVLDVPTYFACGIG